MAAELLTIGAYAARSWVSTSITAGPINVEVDGSTVSALYLTAGLYGGCFVPASGEAEVCAWNPDNVPSDVIASRGLLIFAIAVGFFFCLLIQALALLPAPAIRCEWIARVLCVRVGVCVSVCVCVCVCVCVLLMTTKSNEMVPVLLDFIKMISSTTSLSLSLSLLILSTSNQLISQRIK